MKTTRHTLAVLNRRLDASFEEMERRWCIYKDKRTPENFAAYLAALRRTRKLNEWVEVAR